MSTVNCRLSPWLLFVDGLVLALVHGLGDPHLPLGHSEHDASVVAVEAELVGNRMDEHEVREPQHH